MECGNRFQESSKYMSPAQMAEFLDGAFRSRISVRLLAEQHISISQALDDPSVDKSHVGVVDMHCSPARMIHMCAAYVSELCEATLGSSPTVHIDGFKDATFACVQTSYDVRTRHANSPPLATSRCIWNTFSPRS